MIQRPPPLHRHHYLNQIVNIITPTIKTKNKDLLFQLYMESGRQDSRMRQRGTIGSYFALLLHFGLNPMNKNKVFLDGGSDKLSNLLCAFRLFKTELTSNLRDQFWRSCNEQHPFFQTAYFYHIISWNHMRNVAYKWVERFIWAAVQFSTDFINVH